MTVSFIIVAYNAEKSINNLLNCLNRQDYDHRKIEVVLIDGASTDNTKKIMTQFAQSSGEFMRVTVDDNPKRTLPCGWNVALSHAKCDIILRVDAHAEIADDFISQNVKTIMSGQDICGGKVVSVPVENTKWSEIVNVAENSMFGGSFAAFRHEEKPCYVSTAAFAAYRKSVFDKVGRYNENLARTEDNEMHYRMKKAGYRFYYDPAIRSSRETRSSFKALLKQKYLNGYWIGLTIGVCPKCFSLYHFVPLVFVCAIICFSLLGVFGWWLPMLLLCAAYGIFDIANTVISAVKCKFNPYFPLLLVMFLLLHLSYGIGTLAGLVLLPFKIKKLKTMSNRG